MIKKTIALAALLAASTWTLMPARPEVKARLIGLLDTYTESNGRVLVAVVASPADVVSQAAVELQFAPTKLKLVDARGRSGVEARVVEQEGRTVVQFWPGIEARQPGLQVLGTWSRSESNARPGNRFNLCDRNSGQAGCPARPWSLYIFSRLRSPSA